MIMNQIKLLRKAKKITQKQLGDVLGVAESTISMYESGNRQPDVDTMRKIADYFNVTIDYLIGGENISSSDKDELDEKIIKIFGSLSEADQAQILDYARYLLMREKQDT